ncbi:MAG: hypothetical protein COA33_013585 [Fluviicola sp.]|nr:hypothetical protein [Fluviicola sp.]
MKLPKILLQPKLPESLPEHAKWLSGEGAGSWFVFEKAENNYRITRYSPKGKFECENMFTCSEKFSLEDNFTMNYPSHCSKVTVIQDNLSLKFSVIDRIN